MAIEIRLPALGQTADEMEILSWLKQIGDRVSVAEALLVVETDKAQVDVESPEEGILIKIVAEPGQVLKTGDLVAYLGEEGERTPNSKANPFEKEKNIFTVWHEIVLNPGDQHTIFPDTLHWFQAGPEGAIVTEFSTRSTDEYDVFTDKRIKRITEVAD